MGKMNEEKIAEIQNFIAKCEKNRIYITDNKENVTVPVNCYYYTPSNIYIILIDSPYKSTILQRTASLKSQIISQLENTNQYLDKAPIFIIDYSNSYSPNNDVIKLDLDKDSFQEITSDKKSAYPEFNDFLNKFLIIE